MRLMRFVVGLAVPAAMLFGALAGAGAQVSEQVRQACTPDAMRLCSEFIPDVAKITSCMMRKQAQVSELCRRAMRGAHPADKRGATHRPRVHCVRHGHSCGYRSKPAASLQP